MFYFMVLLFHDYGFQLLFGGFDIECLVMVSYGFNYAFIYINGGFGKLDCMAMVLWSLELILVILCPQCVS